MKNNHRVLGFVLGLGLTFVIAGAAFVIESVMPMPLVGASVLALFIGMLIHHFYQPSSEVMKGIRFSSKRLLKVAIILLGASLNLAMVVQVGKLSLLVMMFTLLTCFGCGYLSGRALGLNWKMSNLISAGTGICGGSAIAAIAPVIEAEDLDVAFALSATFLFDMVMIVLFPWMGQALGLSDLQFGLWAGTAVNDTASVVAAGYAFSNAAGDFATMVKLTRTLSIIPTVIIFALINHRLKRQQSVMDAGHKRLNVLAIFPWFILGFLALTSLHSLGLLPKDLIGLFKAASKFLMVSSLAGIGLHTNLKDMKKAGLKPMIHGFVISLLVIVVALVVILSMGPIH